MKKSRTIKTGIILGLLLVSLFSVFTTSSSAKLLSAEPVVEIYPSNQDPEDLVVPNSGVLDIPLKITFELTGPFASSLESNSLLQNNPLQISLVTEEEDPYVSASITPTFISVVIGEDKDYQATLRITVTELAPALQGGNIIVRASSNELSSLLYKIEKYENTFKIPYQIGYWPVINANPKNGNLLTIGPMDTADFEIELENQGNGPTYVYCEVVEAPEGWTASIDSKANLGSIASGTGGNTKSTVHLIVKPPYGFGFHNDIKNIKVRFLSQYIGRPDLPQVSETKTFTVQSIGMSAGAGYEIPLIVATLVIIGLIFYMYKKRK